MILLVTSISLALTSVKVFRFFHAFTGCDTVSSFYKVRKAKFWAIWLAKIKAGDKSLCTIFKKLSNCPKKIEVNDFDTLCNFVYEAYGLTKQAPFQSRRTDHLISSLNANLCMLVLRLEFCST